MIVGDLFREPMAALAQLRTADIRGALTGSIALPAAPGGDHDGGATDDDAQISDADLQIPLGDAPVPDHGGQLCPPGIAPSSCPSPRPPGSPASPGTTPPG